MLPANIFFEGEAAIPFPEIQPRDGGPRLVSRAYRLGASAGYNFQPTRRLQIFVSGGAEAVVWDPDGFDAETDLGLKYGPGARYFVTPEVALRGDVRWHQVRDALQDTRSQALGVASAAEEDLWAMELSGGVSLFLGGPKDSDGHGVLDGLDRCPDTPEGAEVDETGCPTGALGTLLRDFVSELNRLTVWFDFAESELWEDSRPALNLLGRALAENPDLVVEVQGHTDAVGPEAYNERLARERAEAVRAYLLEEYDEVEANQISVRSFGETRPAAPNETDAGRQKNRRAMVVVVEPRPNI